jgi:hypothetical protein
MADRKRPDYTKFRRWMKMKLQDALETLISEEKITLDMEAQKPSAAYKVACELYTGFADEEIGYEYFRSRLYATRVLLQEKISRAEEDYKDFVSDMKSVKLSTLTNRGLPKWHGSEAKVWLENDMDDFVHWYLKPKAFWLTRQCFQVFSLKTFTKHIYQYEKSKKFKNYCKMRAAQKALKAGKKAADKEMQEQLASLPPGAELPGGGKPPTPKKKRRGGRRTAAAAALPPDAIDLTGCVSDNESHSESDDDSAWF